MMMMWNGSNSDNPQAESLEGSTTSFKSFFSGVSSVSGSLGGSQDKRVVQLEDEVCRLRRELDEERARRQEDIALHGLEMKKLRCEKVTAEKRVEILMRDMEDNNAISKYASLIRKAAPQAIDSFYVLKLQSQLAKAMHRMGILENQVLITEQGCEVVAKTLKNEVADAARRTSRVEAKCANKINKLREDLKSVKEEFLKSVEESSKSEVEYLSQIMKLEDEKMVLEQHIKSGEDALLVKNTRVSDVLPSDFLFSNPETTSQNPDEDEKTGGQENQGLVNSVWGMNIQVDPALQHCDRTEKFVKGHGPTKQREMVGQTDPIKSVDMDKRSH